MYCKEAEKSSVIIKWHTGNIALKRIRFDNSKNLLGCFQQTTERTRRKVNRRRSSQESGRTGGQACGRGAREAQRWDRGWGAEAGGRGQENHGETNAGGAWTTKRGWARGSEKERGNEKFRS